MFAAFVFLVQAVAAATFFPEMRKHKGGGEGNGVKQIDSSFGRREG